MRYPEGHVIRAYEQVLRPQLGLTGRRGERLLDFGCGNGTHAAFFAELGFDVRGVDADAGAIDACRGRFPDLADRFHVIDPDPRRARGRLGQNLDVVLANQVLYYLGDTDLRVCVRELHDALRPGGVLIASMIATRHYLYRGSRPQGNGLRRLDPQHTDGAACYVNFTAGRDELCERLRPFEPLHVGHYDFALLASQPSRLHYLYIGRKADA